MQNLNNKRKIQVGFGSIFTVAGAALFAQFPNIIAGGLFLLGIVMLLMGLFVDQDE